MTRIAIVGGHGAVARHLHPLLVAAGHQPVALVRNDDYRAELEGLGAQVGLLDIEKDDAVAFADAFTGCQAVVFAAGGGPDGSIERKRTVDLEGALKTIEGARRAGLSRVVQISAIGVDEPVGDDVKPVWKAYVEAKRDADAALRESGLDYTIIRPGGLTDDDPTGLVELAEQTGRGEIPRADVAAVVAAVLDTDAGLGAQWDLVGGTTPVAEAVAAFSR